MSTISFIGMPGSGKSYIGKILAQELGYKFVDIDMLIENKFQKKLQDILNEIGEEGFIREEVSMINELKNGSNRIISPGGSVIYSEESMEHLKSISKVVFLNTPLSVIKSRIDERDRGIIGLKNRSMDELFNLRTPLYFKYADLIVNCEGKSSIGILKEIRVGLSV